MISSANPVLRYNNSWPKIRQPPTCKSKALAILVFPKVVKAGFVLGAQGGEGILFEHGRVNGRYRTVAASYGLQAGVQEYGYALFLMNQKAVDG
jgi:lipid-binding SYLF domain-containing protein